MMHVGSIAVTRQAFPDIELNSTISEVQCDGSEMSLLECPFIYLSPAISTPNDAALVCQALSTELSNCTSGDIRLVNGTNELEGRLEICVNNVWGTVCSQGFTADDAEVVCDQLGFRSNGKSLYTSLLKYRYTTTYQCIFCYASHKVMDLFIGIKRVY